MIPADLAMFFLIGLLGGAHCIGMCGPLVTVYANRMNGHATDGGTVTNSRRTHLSLFEVRQHALFNIGRTVSYATIGAAMGALGGFVFVTTDSIAPAASVVRGSVGILVGAFVIVIGVYYLSGRTAGIGAHLPGVAGSRIYTALSTRISRWAGGPGIVGLGAVHGILPCPILYPAFLYAFATGSPTAGFLLLATLGLGTIPAVFLYGTLVETIDPLNRARLHRVLGVAFVVLGYVPLAHGLMLFGIHVPHLELPFYQPLEGIGHENH